MKAKTIVLASVLVWVFNVLAWMASSAAFGFIYTLPPMIWLTPTQMSVPSNLTASLLLQLLIAFLFVVVFGVIRKGVPGEGYKKGVVYGFIAWLIGGFSGTILMPTYMTIHSMVVVLWIVQLLIMNLVAGAITGALVKEKR